MLIHRASDSTEGSHGLSVNSLASHGEGNGTLVAAPDSSVGGNGASVEGNTWDEEGNGRPVAVPDSSVGGNNSTEGSLASSVAFAISTGAGLESPTQDASCAKRFLIQTS